MRKFNGTDIVCLIDALVGDTVPIGETNADNKRLDNLKTLIDVCNWCLDGVWEVAEVEGYEYSVKKAKMTAMGALMEWNEWLKEVIGND